MTSTSGTYLDELLDSATSPEDVQAIAELIEEQEKTEQAKPRAKGKWNVSTLREVADFFGLAYSTVKQWSQDSPPMPGEPGKYPLDEIVKWKLSKTSKGNVSDRKKEQDIRIGALLEQEKEMELAKKRGDLIEVEAVERWASIAITESRERIMALPGMISGSVSQELREGVRAETERHCRDVLNTLAEKLGKDDLQTECSSSL